MKTERPNKPERSSRPSKVEKPERSSRSSKVEKPERSSRPDRISKPEKKSGPERTGRSDRGEKPERSARPERAYKPERKSEPKRSERPDHTEKTGRPEKYERTGRPDRPVKSDRPARPEKFDKTRKPDRPERAGRPERTGRPERSIKLDRSVLPDRTTKPKKVVRRSEKNENPDHIRLNKYIANSGISSRREADRLIEAGAVSVNGIIVTELGTKVGPGDKVQYGDQTIKSEKPRYVLLNKPKGYITTVDDPEKRKTVMSLVAGACKERIYPVGRLDRNTTGLLLFTNDGNIAKKLTHPRYGIKKIYHVEIDKNLARADFIKITDGFRLEDEVIKVDSIEYIGDGKDKKQIGIELHSGQNRIVRRIFEHFEYKVLKLDRVYYAGLTKKNLPRGNYRLLDEQEINLLKMISSKP